MGWAGQQVMDVCACTPPRQRGSGNRDFISGPAYPPPIAAYGPARPAFLPGAWSPRGPTPSGYAGDSAAGRRAHPGLDRRPPCRRSLAPTPPPPLPPAADQRSCSPGTRTSSRPPHVCRHTVSLPRSPACDKFRAGPRPRATAPPAARRCSAARSGVPALNPAHRWSLSPRAPPLSSWSRAPAQARRIQGGFDLCGLGLGWYPLARGTLLALRKVRRSDLALT